ncbi:hypothetical protein CNMCM8927_003628 [Aspergillus lentulus]|uniref:Uncharacterized protein n=1 Tax=Aspergillus lentulus TaxID=293939 RepID=A0AAN6BK37_ASPLE|nr:hypothetical protein CNMCM8060_000824 [Aspergillus lentulus]KAF4189007.1 hypothetical protein CNMCM7927_009677 [Aspergillus lentulus]KAF4194753.1 hypothetical protein CNMCM8694_007236 [Aspergillus lentulus]KAF4200276.1 hypothetical protein CNMCM8927_003628 [Aspergillus lentulus]
MEFNLKSTVSDELTWIGALTNMVPGHIIFNIEPIVGARTVTTRSDRGNAAQASPSARRLSLPADRKGGALTVAPSASFPGLPLSGGAAAERASHGKDPSIARSAIKPDDVYLDPGARGCIQPLLNAHVWKVRCHLYIIYFITGYGSLLPTLETVLASGPQAQSTRPKTARS